MVGTKGETTMKYAYATIQLVVTDDADYDDVSVALIESLEIERYNDSTLRDAGVIIAGNVTIHDAYVSGTRPTGGA